MGCCCSSSAKTDEENLQKNLLNNNEADIEHSKSEQQNAGKSRGNKGSVVEVTSQTDDRDADAGHGRGTSRTEAKTEQKSDDALHKLMRTQSPINLVSKNNDINIMELTKDQMLHSKFKLRYPTKIDGCRIINNGYTVQVNMPKDVSCQLYIKGDVFKLAQFHFHCPSEHTIDNKPFSMEMHLVHLNEDNEIAVMGFIFDVKAQKTAKPKFKLSKSKHHLLLDPQPKKVKSDLNKIDENGGNDDDSDLGTDDDMQDDDNAAEIAPFRTKDLGNDFLNQFFDELVYHKTTDPEDLKNGGRLLSRKLSFDYLFETSSNNISKSVADNEIDIDLDLWEYMGSLTTPPYTEGVNWYVLKKIQHMSFAQEKELKKCWPLKSNARDVQKLHGRVIKVRSGISIL